MPTEAPENERLPVFERKGADDGEGADDPAVELLGGVAVISRRLKRLTVEAPVRYVSSYTSVSKFNRNRAAEQPRERDIAERQRDQCPPRQRLSS